RGRAHRAALDLDRHAERAAAGAQPLDHLGVDVSPDAERWAAAERNRVALAGARHVAVAHVDRAGELRVDRLRGRSRAEADGGELLLDRRYRDDLPGRTIAAQGLDGAQEHDDHSA